VLILRACSGVATERKMMKIGELSERTKVSKQTIHHYINEGVLPKPRKLGVNTADYGERYVERILTVKELQEGHFLPLSKIKKVLKEQRRSDTLDPVVLNIQSKYFKPLDRLLPDVVIGKTAFLEATGLSETWLRSFEEWEIITPELREGQPVYSHDNVTIGKLLVEMDKMGLGPRDGFDPEGLRHVSDIMRDAVERGHQRFLESYSEKTTADEMRKTGLRMIEIMSLYYYHLYRKFSNEVN
jgi:DNA-binding transcriptional MerR regulator